MSAGPIRTARTPGREVPGRAEARAGRTLLLEAELKSVNGGWQVRLPVRAEEVTTSKRVVIREQVVVRRYVVQHVVPVRGTVAREKPRVVTEGRVQLARDRREGGDPEVHDPRGFPEISKTDRRDLQ